MRKARFRDRVLIYFFSIIFLPVLTLGVLGPVLYSGTVAGLSATYTRDRVERVTKNVELTIRSQEKLLQMLLQDEALQQFFFAADIAESRQRLENLFASIGESHPEISGVIAVTRDDRSFSTELERILRDPLIQEDWFLRARAASGDFSLVTRPIGRNLRNLSGVGPDEIVSVIKAVYHPETRQFAGVLMADLSLDYLEASFDGSMQDDTAFFCILDGKGDFVYAPVNTIVYRINPEWFTNSSQIVERTIQNRGYRFIFAVSPYTGWKTIGVYYLEDALRSVRFVRLSALIIGLITIALTVTISVVYTRAISKPLLHLQSVMERAGHGDLTARYDGRSRDEIDELGDGLNSMLDKIQDLVQLVYREQKSKREAELRILQQQIKPHFLYNTLETILWMAEEKGHAQIAEAVAALTKLFRVALSQGREVISVQDEIEHVRSYLTIQKIRYEDKFDFDIHCPAILHPLQVQKMILQPLVENAIYHGVKEKVGSGRISVAIAAREEMLEMVVTDDGVGIPGATLQRINEGLCHLDHESDRSAFALYNVNDRIRLTYGAKYGITVSSEEGAGTVVTITHPIIDSQE